MKTFLSKQRCIARDHEALLKAGQLLPVEVQLGSLPVPSVMPHRERQMPWTEKALISNEFQLPCPTLKPKHTEQI